MELVSAKYLHWDAASASSTDAVAIPRRSLIPAHLYKQSEQQC